MRRLIDLKAKPARDLHRNLHKCKRQQPYAANLDRNRQQLIRYCNTSALPVSSTASLLSLTRRLPSHTIDISRLPRSHRSCKQSQELVASQAGQVRSGRTKRGRQRRKNTRTADRHRHLHLTRNLAGLRHGDLHLKFRSICTSSFISSIGTCPMALPCWIPNLKERLKEHSQGPITATKH